MSKGPETRFIASIHRFIPVEMLYHMKNHNSYIGGPADVWYSGKRDDMWIEYKFVAKLPPLLDLMDTKKDYALSALQQQWLHDRHIEGRTVCVILGTTEGGIIFQNLEWELRKFQREKLTPRVQSREDIAQWISHCVKGTYEIPVRGSKQLERVV